MTKGRFTFKPGVFSYAGFGTGTYYDAQGASHYCTRSEAADRAQAEGIPFIQIDTLQGSSGYTHNWQDYTIPLPDIDPVVAAYHKAAQAALDCQDASNLSGVAKSFAGPVMDALWAVADTDRSRERG